MRKGKAEGGEKHGGKTHRKPLKKRAPHNG